MVNWLDKALGRKVTEAAEPTPFVLTCQCSHRTNGLRQNRARRIICEACGRAHFVLPANVYPASDRRYFLDSDTAINAEPAPSPEVEPSDRRTVRSPTTSPSNDDDELFIDPEAETDHDPAGSVMDLVEAAWSTSTDDTLPIDDDDYELIDSDPEINVPDRPARRKTARRKTPGTESPAHRNHSTTVADSDQPARLELPSATEDRRRQRLRLAAVSGLILVVTAAAIVLTMRSRQLDRAEVAMREGRDLGLIALENRDFVTAREKLGNAVSAMELLGIDEQTRAETRQFWLQAEAGFGLLDDTDVVEIAIAAETATVEPDDPSEEVDDSDWQRQFRAQYFDRWLCIQLEPVEVIESDDDAGDRVVFPAMPLVHLSGLDSVLSEQSGGRIWFAGPLESCRRDPLHESAWLISFDSSRVIACDGTESLVRPMLSKEQQATLTSRSSANTSSPLEAKGSADE